MNRAACAVVIAALTFWPWVAANAAEAPRGTLFIAGGGDLSEELCAEFVRIAGGRGTARVAVVPMASEDAASSGEESAERWRRLGAKAFVLNLSRDEAADAKMVSALDDATGVWFGGGDQARLAAVLRDTPVLAKIVERYHGGAVIGGTSAGAAIMSAWMITGNQVRPETSPEPTYYDDEFPRIARDTIEVAPGFGLLPTAIVDQHFIRRERANRLLTAVLERPELLGVGIDEGTAVIVSSDGRWTVTGESAAVVVDARETKVTAASAARLGATGVRVHVLPAGSTFAPATGAATLPDAP
jgi:cyanophycinase